jgi:glycosyltransferase involved in cell wall biosynthesis
MRTAPLKQFDVILCESSTLAACCPRNGPPVYVWTDAEIQSYVDTYWPDSRRARIANLDQAVDQEQRALDRMTNMLCASLWTMEEVSRRYRLSGPGHLVLAPFFDNLPHPPSREDAIAMANQRPEDVLRLLFIGVDWQRKGGPRVLDLVQAIRARGVNTELTIIGARPFESGDTPPGVRQLGFLDKTDPDQAKQFSELLQQSHFLILLSRAEAMGIALIEALAYAAPCIGANSGGIPTIVADGDNGILDPGGGIERLANQVLEVFGSKPAYLEMARHARASYDERFSRSVRLEQLETVLWAGRQERQAFSNAAAHD